MCTNTSGKEGLSETRRPDLIMAMRPDYPDKPQWFVPQDPLWGILFLRLKGTKFDTQGGVFDGGHYALLSVKVKLFITTRDRKCPLEVFKRLPPCDDLLSVPMLSWDGDNVGIVLSPQINLIETVKLWNKEGHCPYSRTWLGGHCGCHGRTLTGMMTMRIHPSGQQVRPQSVT